MKQSELPPTRVARMPGLAGLRLSAAWASVRSAFSRIRFGRILLVTAALAVAMGAIGYLYASCVRREAMRERAREADVLESNMRHRRYAHDSDMAKAKSCKQWNGVRTDGIVRLDALRAIKSSHIVQTGWRVYSYVGQTKEVRFSDNYCPFSFVIDLPSGQAMWALQLTEMRDGECICWMQYHVAKIDDARLDAASNVIPLETRP